MGDLRPPYRPDTGTWVSAGDPGLEGYTGDHTHVRLDLGIPPRTETISDVFGHDRPGLIQEWTTRFVDKQRDYGDSADDLGAPGQYAEIHRKKAKLKKALWDGEPLTGEPAREVLMDLIGHCFLAIRHLDSQNYGGKPTR